MSLFSAYTEEPPICPVILAISQNLGTQKQNYSTDSIYQQSCVRRCCCVVWMN